MKQDDNEGLTEFTKRFNNAVDIMETQNGMQPLLDYLKTRDDFKAATTDAEKTAIHLTQYNRLKAFAYLKALDVKKSSKLVEDLNNQFALGNDQFPNTVAKATETVVAYRNRVNNQQTNRNRNNNNNNNNRNNENQNVSFGQSTTKANDNRGNASWKKNQMCFNYGEKGHYTNECPKRRSETLHVNWEDTQNEDGNGGDSKAFCNFLVKSPGVHHESFGQDTSKQMKNWILLDTGSLTDIFCDDKMLVDISKDKNGLTLHTNGGILESQKSGELPKYGKVWHNKKALTNILSFFHLNKKFHVTFDNKKDEFFHVFLDDGREIKFGPSQNGIYHYC